MPAGVYRARHVYCGARLCGRQTRRSEVRELSGRVRRGRAINTPTPPCAARGGSAQTLMYFCAIILGVSSTNSADFPPEPFVERYHPQQVRAGDERGPFSRDRDRIIHSSAFRRLQSKTQVSAPREGDVHRTRLTHSLETGQIGEAIASRLRGTAVPREWIPGGDLISAACYAHDLGHPPLGHAGEQTLHAAINGVEFDGGDKQGRECLKTYGGFEANAQTLRLLTRLMPYARPDQGGQKTLVLIPGINLTRRTLLAILKYPRSYGSCAEEVAGGKLPKCYFDSEQEIVEWMAEPFPEEDRKRFLGQRKYKTLDSAVMDIADEIAYCTHDMEDAIARGFLTQEQFQEGWMCICKTEAAGTGRVSKPV